MKEQRIGFILAKLARKKGFDWPVNCTWFEYKDGSVESPGTVLSYYTSNRTLGSMVHAAPTQSFLQKWLRDVHKIWVSPMYIGPDTCKYHCRTDIGGSGRVGEHGAWFESHEEAFEDGLYKALMFIK